MKSADTAHPPRVTDEFYVGYLPMPRGFARTLCVLVPILLIMAGSAAVLLGAVQRGSDGPAGSTSTWEHNVETFEGTIVASPTPMLLRANESGEIEGMLLVLEGKHGAQDITRMWDGKNARVKARRLLRQQPAMDEGGKVVRRTMLEVITAADAIVATNLGPAVVRPVFVGEPAANAALVLRGEILDAKCYFGAMKPGAGKGHKACATLCIQNGIPAMFLDDRGELWLLVENASQTQTTHVGMSVLDSKTQAMIGEPIELLAVRGRIANLAALQIIGQAERLKR